MMTRLICGVSLAAMLAGPAAAGETTLTYQAVTHVSASDARPVLDDKAHLVGFGAFRGLAIFPDGKIAIHRYEGTFDLTSGTGKYQGYALWRFDDGSELRAEYEGTVREAAAEDFEIQATLHHVTGSGRFARASGEGTFEGRRMEPIEAGGDTYLKGTLRLKLPD